MNKSKRTPHEAISFHMFQHLVRISQEYTDGLICKEEFTHQQQVDNAVRDLFKHAPIVGLTGNLRIGEFNAEFGNKPKAIYYAQAYAEMLKHFHVVALEEVDPQFVQAIAQANGYWWVCSPPNSRGQGVAIVGSDRIEKIGNAILYWQLTNIYGIPDLRPALELLLKDKATGQHFRVRVIHLKSMRGGEWDTSPVRYAQCKILSKLISSEPLFQAGDYNCFLNNTSDTQALTKAGWELIEPCDSRITQRGGGRLNGIFTWNMNWKLVLYEVYSSFLDKSIGNAWSDHSVIGAEIDLG